MPKSWWNIGFLNYVTKISRSWDEPNGKESSKAMTQSNSKRGMYTLNEVVGMEAKMTALTRRLEELKSRGAHEVKVVNDVSMKIVQYSICQSTKHLVSECSIILAIREIFVEQANTIRFFKQPNNSAFSNTFNLE